MMIGRIWVLCMSGLLCLFSAEANGLKAAIQSGINKIKNSKFGQSQTGQALFGVVQAVGGAAKSVGQQVAMNYAQTTLIPKVQQEAAQLRTNIATTGQQYLVAIKTKAAQVKNDVVTNAVTQIENASNAINALISNLNTTDNNIQAGESQAGGANGQQNPVFDANQQQWEAQKQNLSAQLKQYVAVVTQYLSSLKTQFMNDVGAVQLIDSFSNMMSSVSDITSLKDSLDMLRKSVFADKEAMKTYITNLNLQGIAQNIWTKLSSTPQAASVQNFINNIKSLENLDTVAATAITNAGVQMVNKINAYGQANMVSTVQPLSTTQTAYTVPTTAQTMNYSLPTVNQTMSTVPTAYTVSPTQTMGTVPTAYTVNPTQTMYTTPTANNAAQMYTVPTVNAAQVYTVPTVNTVPAVVTPTAATTQPAATTPQPAATVQPATTARMSVFSSRGR